MKLKLTAIQSFVVRDKTHVGFGVHKGHTVTILSFCDTHVTIELNKHYTIEVSRDEYTEKFNKANVVFSGQLVKDGDKVVITDPKHIHFGVVLTLYDVKMLSTGVRVMYRRGIHNFNQYLDYSCIEHYDEGTKYEGMIVFYDENDTVEKIAHETYTLNCIAYVVVTDSSKPKLGKFAVELSSLGCYLNDESDKLVPLDSIYGY